MLEIKGFFKGVNIFTKSFGGVLNQESVDKVQRMLTETVTDNVHKTNAKNINTYFYFNFS